MIFTISLRSQARALVASAALVATATGCGAKKTVATAQDLVADRNGKNIALLFGASNGLEGVATDLGELEKLFKSSTYDLGFEVHVIPEATEAKILSETAKWAKETGDRGTLFWYFTGHGAKDGTLYTADQGFLGWRDIAKAIKSARATPLKRLMVLEDSCFSGAVVDGAQAIGKYSAATADAEASASASTIQAAFSAENGRSGSYDAASLYEQILILSASRKSETSVDAGAGEGSAFTASFRDVLQKLRSQPNATIKDFVTQTQTETEQSFGHTPQFRAEPSDLVLNDALFKRAGGAAGTTGASLTLALGAVIGEGRFAAAIAAPQGTASVGLCLGAKATCTAAKRVDLAFGAGAASSDRQIFRANSALQLTDGAVITLLAFKADGTVADAIAVQASKH